MIATNNFKGNDADNTTILKRYEVLKIKLLEVTCSSVTD